MTFLPAFEVLNWRWHHLISATIFRSHSSQLMHFRDDLPSDEHKLTNKHVCINDLMNLMIFMQGFCEWQTVFFISRFSYALYGARKCKTCKLMANWKWIVCVLSPSMIGLMISCQQLTMINRTIWQSKSIISRHSKFHSVIHAIKMHRYDL